MLQTAGPRIVAAATSIIVAKAVSWGIPLDATTTTAVMLGAYAMIHKAISSVVNPGDAAKGRVAQALSAASKDGGTVAVPAPSHF